MKKVVIQAGSAGIAVVLAAALSTARQDPSTITVRAGEDLQAALDRAQPGNEVRLEAGATFEGNFQLPAKSGSQPITIRSATADRLLPGSSERIGPHHEPLLATIRSPNARPALATAPGADHWRILALQIQGSGGTDIIRLGDGSGAQRDHDDVPGDLVLDRVIVRGDPEKGQKRGIALNSGATTIRNSYIADIKLAGQETQAIAGWNGPGPYVIENNYLEAAGVNVLFGGSEPFIGDLVPTNIVFRRNLVTKPLAWRAEPWTVKNLFELKNARRVLIEGNVFEHNWLHAQVGYAILFTVRNPGNRAPWSTIEDVTFQNNIVRRVSAGINILGFDTNATSRQTRGIVIRNNLFEELDQTKWGGNGTFLQLGEEPANITVEHNTIVQSGNVITAWGGRRNAPRPIRALRFAHNIAFHNRYGIFGNGHGFGNSAIAAYFPDGEIVGNVLAGGEPGRYPDGNLFPTVEELLEQFVSPATGDYRLTRTSFLRRSSSGVMPGVDFTGLNAAIGR